LLDNCTSFTSSRMKDVCQKWKVKLRGAHRLSGTGIVECFWKSLTQGAIRNSLYGLTRTFYDRSTPYCAVLQIRLIHAHWVTRRCSAAIPAVMIVCECVKCNSTTSWLSARLEWTTIVPKVTKFGAYDDWSGAQKVKGPDQSRSHGKKVSEYLSIPTASHHFVDIH